MIVADTHQARRAGVFGTGAYRSASPGTVYEYVLCQQQEQRNNRHEDLHASNHDILAKVNQYSLEEVRHRARLGPEQELHSVDHDHCYA